MNLSQKIAAKLQANKPGPGQLTAHDPRDWARKPRSQRAVDLAIEGKLFEELADARAAGYVIGDKWVPPQQRGNKT